MDEKHPRKQHRAIVISFLHGTLLLAPFSVALVDVEQR
jgi:hypothetical protein